MTQSVKLLWQLLGLLIGFWRVVVGVGVAARLGGSVARWLGGLVARLVIVGVWFGVYLERAQKNTPQRCEPRRGVVVGGVGVVSC